MPEPEIAMPAKVDPVKAALERLDVITEEAVLAVVTPVLLDRDQRIADLQEELRLERIRGDQTDRLHARAERVAERRVKELQGEVEASRSHEQYLRGQVADLQAQVEALRSEAVAKAIEAMASAPGAVRHEAPPATPASVLDLGGLAQAIVQAQRPMFTELATALKPVEGEVEIVRDDRGQVTGARRVRRKASEEGQQMGWLPLPE